jgi:D-threo-aldose 1-dehydrogenase
MEAACARHGVPLAAAALQFSMRDPRIASTIIGMSKPERIAQTIELAAVAIPAALWDELESLAPTENPDPQV